jgi:hypothetical protein
MNAEISVVSVSSYKDAANHELRCERRDSISAWVSQHSIGKPEEHMGKPHGRKTGRRAVRASWSAHHNMLAVRSGSGKKKRGAGGSR